VAACADWVDVPQSGFTDKSYARARRNRLSPPFGSAAAPMAPGVPPGAEGGFPYASMPASDENGTTHFSVVDRFGTLIAYTTTIENNWGSGVVVPGQMKALMRCPFWRRFICATPVLDKF
jgi:gamma-glutamyltranspeptidase/glutathione hydrolase